MELEFVGFRKIPRLSRDCIITEKIDGTNGQIYIAEDSNPIELKSGRVVPFLVGSRSRWIYPEGDNFGFAAWCYEHAEELLQLGPGRHFGEWWGKGIQRNYDLKERRFSLFNPYTKNIPACCHIVPVLYEDIFTTDAVEFTLEDLKVRGSFAVPGFLKPEGIVVYHVAANSYFKKTIEGDAYHKGVSKDDLSTL